MSNPNLRLEELPAALVRKIKMDMKNGDVLRFLESEAYLRDRKQYLQYTTRKKRC